MMLEVYRYSDASSIILNEEDMMKHSAPNIESFEFNLGQAPLLRCVSSEKNTSCAECETCLLNAKLRQVKEWFPRLGDHSQKRFMLGLMRRLHSADILGQIVKLLQPMLCKDFTYSRSRSNPSLKTDTTTLSSDRAMPERDVDDYIASTWHWFGMCNYWSKANFALVLLRMCDAHLLHVVGTQARTLLISEARAASEMQDYDYMERESIASSNYTFKTDEHPDLRLLTVASREYGTEAINPLTGETFPGLDLGDTIENDAGDEDSIEESALSSLDPAYIVIPTSAKAYAGVSKYMDLIRMLPVHISKMILGLLDEASLSNALCVSGYWRQLAEEVRNEFHVNQQLLEEFMLMQLAGGAAAQGANPVYANDIDVLVPNVTFETGHVIKTDDAIIRTKFKSEVSFETAYSGISTRKVIMEERNVYCGPYNVMVLCDQVDPNRVVHTDGGRLIAVASKDRKIRFIDNITGREHKRMTKGESKDDELPIITGHAGSVRCVHIIEEKGIVLSGSYDTSIRMWKISSAQCLKIFRGHRDTVLTIRVLRDLMISGGKDNACKVWDMQTGKCMRTFRHSSPVQAVAMSTYLCISGDEKGKVKVWNLKSGELVKVLLGHQGCVTAIQFDRWHIATGGRDGYALIWSAQGNHNRCLQALRHPKEVLCVEFTYLRCITGCGDGRIRIWNIISGQCCRIMRGNSRSDPILNILAIDDRITINTAVNLLVLNFEKVEWDYSLEEDKVPPLVQYGSYSDAPVRPQPYPYIRAQRMKKAGASNVKILNREGMEEVGRKVPMSQLAYRASQLPHSAKTLSARSLGSARYIQSQGDDAGSIDMREGIRSAGYVGKGSAISRKSQTLSAGSKPPLPKSAKSRPLTSKSGASMHSVTIIDDVMEHEMIDEWREPLILQRRVSWAFEKPILPKTKDISLSETKSLLRSQMRAKAENIVPPDFIYLTVNQIQSSMKPTETNTNTEQNMQESRQIRIDTRLNRPSSSPPKIDPRTKVPVEQLDLSMFQEKPDDETLSEISDFKSVKSLKSTKSRDSIPVATDKEIYSTRCEVKHIRTSPKTSVHPKRIKTTLPRGRLIRPISASAQRKEPLATPPRAGRPVTAPAFRARPDTATSVPSQIAASMPGVQPPRKKVQGVGTTGEEVSIVPMLMYPTDMREKLAMMLKEKRLQRHEDQLESASEMGVGKVSPFNDPMRSHVKFELRTHNQESDFIRDVEKQHVEKREKDEALVERRKRLLWTAKARGGERSRIQSAPVS